MAQANWYKTSNPGGLEQNAYGYEWTVTISDDTAVTSPSFEWPVTEGFTMAFRSEGDGTSATTAAYMQGDVLPTFANAMTLSDFSSFIDLDDETLETYYYPITSGVCPFMRIYLKQSTSPSAPFDVTITVIPHTI